MAKVKDIVETLKSKNVVVAESVDTNSTMWLYTVQAMHTGFLILFVVMMLVLYFLIRKYRLVTVKVLNILSYYVLPVISLSWVIYV